eukprot:TRINITY_DN1256_c0_g1_i1.p1 TRINITY_DN1256_c0_g1~~TRINITY_DN1256_c0_g1_i1.p1  ORF type:complete len:354 (-),score=42.76 TRINITY_DN1256_c0_g1_i1:10-1035(-)
MCGRAACTLAAASYRRRAASTCQRAIGAWRGEEAYQPTYNLCPTRQAPVIISERNPLTGEENLVVCTMRWGIQCGGTMAINARAESLTEKPAFKSLLTSGRCLVMLDGFYEWQKQEKATDKKPYFVYPVKKENDVEASGLLAIAGLYRWEHGSNDETDGRFVIVTTASTGEFAKIHDRMPCVLATPEDINRWLSGPFETAQQTLLPSDTLMWHPVHPKIGKWDVDTKDCTERYEPLEKQHKITDLFTSSKRFRSPSPAEQRHQCEEDGQKKSKLPRAVKKEEEDVKDVKPSLWGKLAPKMRATPVTDCPVCGMKTPASSVNQHLDVCLQRRDSVPVDLTQD